MSSLPVPDPGPDAAVEWVAQHLVDLCRDEPRASPLIRGGQTAADAALAAFDPTGYAARRNEVWPADRRGASVLSPYIRYGLLPLQRVWDHVGGAPARDRDKFRDELLWQEYARHAYARLGARHAQPWRSTEPRAAPRWPDPWPRDMACMELGAGEMLERDGWVVNQVRMWLASQWTVRAGHDWRAGEDEFFAHLLDGSRAANRLGWQWTVGTASAKAYGFSRWQVEKRAPGLCATCPRRLDCPIQEWPDIGERERLESPPELAFDADPAATAGPGVSERRAEARAVWLTGESLGDADPALAAHPDLPAVFCFDERLLARLRLSSKRLVLLTETLADLALRRPVELHRGDPVAVAAERHVAVTFAPVPGFRARVERAQPAEVHPWPWLVPPHAGRAQSFSAWRRAAGLADSVPRRRGAKRRAPGGQPKLL